MANHINEEIFMALDYLWKKHVWHKYGAERKAEKTFSEIKCLNCGEDVRFYFQFRPDMEPVLLQVPETNGWSRSAICPHCFCLCEIAYWSAALVDNVVRAGE